MPRNASDERQLLGTTDQGRCIFTFNVRDFLVLVKQHSHHGEITLAAQASWSLTNLITTLDNLLSKTETEEWAGRVQWLEARDKTKNPRHHPSASNQLGGFLFTINQFIHQGGTNDPCITIHIKLSVPLGVDRD